MCSNRKINELGKVIFISILLLRTRECLLGVFTVIVSSLKGYYHW